MTDVGHHGKHHATDTTPNPGRLPLSGNPTAPLVIYVQVFVVNSLKVAGFSTDQLTYYVGGIQWSCGAEYAMFMNFHYPVSITEITCAQPYSQASSGTSPAQLMCLVPVPEETEYSFYVHFADGTFHDPKILVTPITAAHVGHKRRHHA